MQVFMARLGRAAVMCALPLAVSLVSPSAFAQKAGTYTGENSEGYEVQVVVANVNGSLAVTGMSDAGAIYCKGVEAGGEGLYIGLSGQPIMDRKATIDLLDSSLYFHGDLKFRGDKVKGTIDFSVPVFSGTKEPPKKACAAKAMKQTFTATLGGQAMHPLPAGTAYAVPLAAK